MSKLHRPSKKEGQNKTHTVCGRKQGDGVRILNKRTFAHRDELCETCERLEQAHRPLIPSVRDRLSFGGSHDQSA